jgi:hypothetical protein
LIAFATTASGSIQETLMEWFWTSTGRGITSMANSQQIHQDSILLKLDASAEGNVSSGFTPTHSDTKGAGFAAGDQPKPVNHAHETRCESVN